VLSFVLSAVEGQEDVLPEQIAPIADNVAGESW
jgi:hypothetical protein